MPPVGFEPTVSAGERPQTYALDRAATGTGKMVHECSINAPIGTQRISSRAKGTAIAPTDKDVCKSCKWAKRDLHHFAFQGLIQYTGSSKKTDGIWNRYNSKSSGRIYTFRGLKCSEKFKVLDLP